MSGKTEMGLYTKDALKARVEELERELASTNADREGLRGYLREQQDQLAALRIANTAINSPQLTESMQREKTLELMIKDRDSLEREVKSLQVDQDDSDHMITSLRRELLLLTNLVVRGWRIPSGVDWSTVAYPETGQLIERLLWWLDHHGVGWRALVDKMPWPPEVEGTAPAEDSLENKVRHRMRENSVRGFLDEVSDG